MKRMKTFLIYALFVVGFFILSELLIEVGINCKYNDLQQKASVEQVQISEAKATTINGKIIGKIDNTSNELTGKSIKVELYSIRDNFLTDRTIEIEECKDGKPQKIDIKFELSEVGSYKISIIE